MEGKLKHTGAVVSLAHFNPFGEDRRCAGVLQRCVPDGLRLQRDRSGTSSEQSHLSLLRQLQCVFDLNSEVSHRAFKLGVTQQELDSTQIFRAPVNQGRFCPPYGVRPIRSRIKADFLDPGVNYSGILPGAEMGRSTDAAWEKIIVGAQARQLDPGGQS